MRRISLFDRIVKGCMVAWLLASVLAFSSGCLDPQTPTIYSPRPGTFAFDQTVTINIPEADAIYYTLDGTTPAPNCKDYFTTGPIQINSPTEIKVMYIDNGQEVHVTESGIFNITNGSGGGDSDGSTDTNKQMVLDWTDHEQALRLLLSDQNNCGEEVQAGCDDQMIPGLGALWWICDNYDPVAGAGYTDGSFTSHRDSASGSLAACQNEGHGWATWIVSMDGSSIFKYSNFTLTQNLMDSISAPDAPHTLYPLPSGSPSFTAGALGMTVTGSMVGKFAISGSGTNASANFNHYGDGSDSSPHLKISGSYTGYIESVLTVTTRIITSGSNTAYCDSSVDPSCASAPVIFAAPNWGVFVLPAEPSCMPPWYVIENQYHLEDRCYQAPAEGQQSDFLEMVPCVRDEVRQRWTFSDATPDDGADNLWIAKSVADMSQCLTIGSDGKLFPLDWLYVRDCGINDANQQVSFINTGQKNVVVKVGAKCANQFLGPINHLNMDANCDTGQGWLGSKYHAFYSEAMHPPTENMPAVLQNQ